MPTSDSYVFRVTIAGGDAVADAKKIRQAIEAEFKQVTMIQLGNIPEARMELEGLKTAAASVGKAMTAGFRGAVTRLITDIGTLQQQVNAVVRAGAGPVQVALADLGVMGLDALQMVEAGTTEETQKMARLTTEIRGAQAQIQALQARLAELGARPMIPAGSMTGEVRTLDELFKEMTSSRLPQVRRLFRDMQADMEPITAEIRRQAETMQAEAIPAYDAAKQRMAELQQAHAEVIQEQQKHQKFTSTWRELAEESRKYTQAIYEADQELTALRSIIVGGGMDKEISQLRYQQEAYLRPLEEATVWWKELTRGAGQHAEIIEYVAKQDREAGSALGEMVASWEQIGKLQASISRGIGTMQRMQERVELPPGTEGTLATLVIAERSLGESTQLSAEALGRQKKILADLVKLYDQTAQAASGLDRVQRAALARVQRIGEQQIKAAVPLRGGMTVTEAGAAITPILAQVTEQTEAIRQGVMAQVAQMEAEGTQKGPFGFLIRAAQNVRRLLVGESIIPEMVTAINEWLAKIGIQNPFDALAVDAQRAGEMIQVGLQDRLKALSTEQAQVQLEELQAELKETASAIEGQLVATGQASQAYKKAFADYAAEVQRVRGESPAAMGLLAQGKALKGTGVRGEFKELAIIDEGYQAIQTTVQERQRLSEEETTKLLALETRYTAMRQAALTLDQELTERKLVALEKAREEAFSTDIDKFETLTAEYCATEDHLNEVTKELAFEREMVTSKAVAAAEESLAQTKAQARRTIPTGLGTEVAGQMIMPAITKVQVKNVQEYTEAIQGLGKAMQQARGTLPLLSEEEQKRVVATVKATTQAEEAERRLTAVRRSELHIQEVDHESAANKELEIMRQQGATTLEEAKQVTGMLRAEDNIRVAQEKQMARAAAATTIEEERRLTAALKEEERRRTMGEQDEIRKRQQAEMQARKARVGPTAAELARYGGGTLGTLSWAVQESQMAQMGLRMLTYDMQYAARTTMMAGAAMTGPPILAMKRFADYAGVVDRSARAMNLAKNESDYLRVALIEQSRTLALASPEQMAAGMYYWVTGIGTAAKNQQELNQTIAATIPIQKMSYMQQMNLDAAIRTSAGIISEFGMNVSDTERVVATLDSTADQTFATVEDLGEAFIFVGPIAKSLGISMEDTASALGLLADANIRGTMAGRAMRQMLIKMTETTEEEDQKLNEMLQVNEELGQSWRDIVFPEGKFIGLARWIDLLAAATADMTEEERSQTLAIMATANELPALTSLVNRQLEARKAGINILRAETKRRQGILDEEVQAYVDWSASTTGKILTVESSVDAFNRKFEQATESEVYELQKLKVQWDATMLALGQHTMQAALPALSQIVDKMEDLEELIRTNPWIVDAVLVAGGVLTAVGTLGMVAGTMLRIATAVRTMTLMQQMLEAARTATAATQAAAAGTQVVAADTQVAAAETQIVAANTAATKGALQVGALMKVVGVLAAVAGGFEVGLGVTNVVRGARGEEALGQMEALQDIWDYLAKSASLVAGTGGMITAALLGEDPAEAFQVATYEAGKLLGMVEETADQGWGDWPDETRYLTAYVQQTRQEVQGLGDDLMQVGQNVKSGLAVYSEEELQAIDELESYLQAKNEMIEDQNEKLAKMQEEFNQEEDNRYKDYMKERAKLEAEMMSVTQEPLWQQTEEYIKVQERITEAQEEFQKDWARAQKEHQKKLQQLKEDHNEKMEDLEASRDAKGIIQENRRYKQAKRDESDRYAEEQTAIEERLAEALAKEQESLVILREERKADLQTKLAELDQNYADETIERQEQFALKQTEQQAQNQQELIQLDEAHAQRLASIMGWEEKVKQQLREKYIGREQDLRNHLAKMKLIYEELYNLAGQPAPTPGQIPSNPTMPSQPLHRQAGGYAGLGTYLLGEAGPEFVLSSPTTRALERAIGPLNQEKLLSSSSTYYGSLDIRVRADDHFSPAFAKQTEEAARKQIVGLAERVTRKRAVGWRRH